MSPKHFVAVAIAAAGLSGAHAQTVTTTDWATFSRMLSLVQVVVQTAEAACRESAGTCDPAATQKAFDDLLHGKNPDANLLMLEIFADMPPAEREKLLSLGRSMAAMAKKQVAVQSPVLSDTPAIRARKDLAGMGLTYHDTGHFLDAVRRNDVIAVRLFLAGRGVDPGAKDLWGNSALDIAKRGGHPEMVALLSSATR
jgi:hypothetical protein